MTDTCQDATTKEQTITVKPASVTVTITGNTASKTYIGSEQSVTGLYRQHPHRDNIDRK